MGAGHGCSGQFGSMSDVTAGLLQFEFRIRGAEDRVALRFITVNELGALVDADQTLMATGYDQRHFKVMGVSGIAKIDRSAPSIHGLEAVIRNELTVTRDSQVTVGETAQWSRLELPPFFAWVPLHQPGRKGRPEGGIMLLRYRAFTDKEKALLTHIGSIVSQGIAAIRGRTYQYRIPIRRKLTLVGFLAALGTAFMGVVPVNLTAVAPAKVVALQPQVVAAPLAGVIERVWVKPAESVDVGDLLVSYRLDELKAEAQLAENRLKLAQAAFEQASNIGFVDVTARAELARLQADVELAEAQLSLANERLELGEIRADRAGVAVIDRPDTWQGRPVQPGERILDVVDGGRVRLQIDLAVENLIPIETGDTVRLALNEAPLNSIAAQIDYMDFEPQPTDAGVLSYRVMASFDPSEPTPPLGALGTARVIGPESNLLYQLLRRPLVAIRQSIGG